MQDDSTPAGAAGTPVEEQSATPVGSRTRGPDDRGATNGQPPVEGLRAPRDAGVPGAAGAPGPAEAAATFPRQLALAYEREVIRVRRYRVLHPRRDPPDAEERAVRPEGRSFWVLVGRVWRRLTRQSEPREREG